MQEQSYALADGKLKGVKLGRLTDLYVLPKVVALISIGTLNVRAIHTIFAEKWQVLNCFFLLSLLLASFVPLLAPPQGLPEDFSQEGPYKYCIWTSFYGLQLSINNNDLNEIILQKENDLNLK